MALTSASDGQNQESGMSMSYLESQQPRIWGYFLLILKYLLGRVEGHFGLLGVPGI